MFVSLSEVISYHNGPGSLKYLKEKNFFHQCLQQMNHTDNLMQWLSFLCKVQEILKLRCHQPPGSEITHPDMKKI